MKESRFIELVNLYVDRQISTAETAELEAEIQVSPRHRKIYQQYCHMQRATKLVYESFRANADQPVAEGAVRGGSIAQFEHSRQRNRWAYAVGGIAAAAACFAVVMVRSGSFSRGSALASAQPAPVVVAAMAAPAAQPAVIPASLPANDSQVIFAEQQTAAQLSAKRLEEMRTFALSQQRATQSISLFADDAFETKQLMNADSKKVFQLKRKSDKGTSTEFTAFQFQR